MAPSSTTDLRRSGSSCQRARIECIPVGEDAKDFPRRSRKHDDGELLTKVQNLEFAFRDLALQTSHSAPEPSSPSDQWPWTLAEIAVPASTVSTSSEDTPYESPDASTSANAGQTLPSGGRWIAVLTKIQELKQYLTDDRLKLTRPASISPSISDDPYSVLFPHTSGPSESLVANMPVPQLWRIYLRNIHPFYKFLHAPTVHGAVLQTLKRSQSLDVGTTAVLTAVIYLSVDSLSEDVCMTMMQEEKKILLSKCKRETERALIKAKLLAGGSLLALQAFIVYLMATRSAAGDAPIWSTIGVAYRVAGNLGLHQQSSYEERTSTDATVSRQLWWELVSLDVQSAKNLRSDVLQSLSDSNTLAPTIADEIPSTGITESFSSEDPQDPQSTICLTRYEITASLAALKITNKDIQGWAALSSILVSIDQKQQSIDALQENLQAIITSQPEQSQLQCFSVMIAQATVCEMRLFSVQTLHGTSEIVDISLRTRQKMFDICLKAMELHLRTYYVVEERWLLQYCACFNWSILTHLLRELRYANGDEKAERAWDVVRKLLDEVVPAMIAKDTNAKEHFARIHGLASRAWATHVHEMSEQASTIGTSLASNDSMLPATAPILSPDSRQWQAFGFMPGTPVLPSQINSQPPTPHFQQQQFSPMEYDTDNFRFYHQQQQ
ncbi:MAG: hypothetical protein M1828_001678 [Chrysothrix sp. TS-e1954]|nr:MAG: hypothetical protein M1828_001678 [Chrysothrix sp. TS-e1954]